MQSTDNTGAVAGQWSSRFAFLMAAIGSAVGLGNIWKFPYMVGNSGGSAFVLVYLGAVLLVGVPVLVAELMLGRLGRKGPIGSMVDLGRRYAGTAHWGWLAVGGVVTALMILSFYSVVTGWSVAYVPKLAAGDMTGIDGAGAASTFGGLLDDPWRLVFWHSLFMLLNIVIIARGVQQGIEVAVGWLMPALFIMLIALVGYAAVEGEFMAGLSYMFRPDFSALTPGIVVLALGQAMFSLSVGLGTMLAYGAYLPDGVSIPRTSVMVAVADTVSALIAGIAIFPIVFANGLNPGEGPGLVFMTLPVAFGSMPAGSLFGTLFFVLLVVAALASSVSLLETVVASLEGQVRMGRVALSVITGLAAWVLGLLTVFSFNIWKDVHPLGHGMTWFDLIDYATSNVLLPLGGVLFVVFAGWVVARRDAREILAFDSEGLFRVWHFLLRYVAPICILLTAIASVA